MKTSLAKALLLIAILFPLSSYANEIASYDAKLNLQIPLNYLSCSQDSDCTAVSTGVCGDNYQAVSTKYKADIEKTVQAKRMTMNCSSFNDSAIVPASKCVMSTCQLATDNN